MFIDNYNDKDFYMIMQKTFNNIYSYDKNFIDNLQIFEEHDKKYNKNLENICVEIIINLLNNINIRHKKQKCKLLKLKYKPLVLGIYKSDRFEKSYPDMYLQLQLFEKNLDYFYSYIIRIICLEKEYYKICENKFHIYLHGIDNNLYNTFVTLKSIESFQIDLEEYFKVYDAYIDAFKSGFDVNMNINHDHNKPYLLQFYLKKLNDYNKKKVKHPHC